MNRKELYKGSLANRHPPKLISDVSDLCNRSRIHYNLIYNSKPALETELPHWERY